MARVDQRGWRILREFVGELSPMRWVGLTIWFVFACLSRVTAWGFGAVDQWMAEQFDEESRCRPCQSVDGVQAMDDKLVSMASGAMEHQVVEQRRAAPSLRFYAVRRGRTPGLYFTWSDCSRQVTGFSGAQHKRFGSLVEAEVVRRRWMIGFGPGSVSGAVVLKYFPIV